MDAWLVVKESGSLSGGRKQTPSWWLMKVDAWLVVIESGRLAGIVKESERLAGG